MGRIVLDWWGEHGERWRAIVNAVLVVSQSVAFRFIELRYVL